MDGLFPAAKKDTFLGGRRSPLVANFQSVTRQQLGSAGRRVTIRKEKPDGFATGKGKFLAAHFDPPRATKMEPSHHTPQAQPARFDAET
jgi:hypothetical protein